MRFGAKTFGNFGSLKGLVLALSLVFAASALADDWAARAARASDLAKSYSASAGASRGLTNSQLVFMQLQKNANDTASQRNRDSANKASEGDSKSGETRKAPDPMDAIKQAQALFPTTQIPSQLIESSSSSSSGSSGSSSSSGVGGDLGSQIAQFTTRIQQAGNDIRKLGEAFSQEQVVNLQSGVATEIAKMKQEIRQRIAEVRGSSAREGVTQTQPESSAAARQGRLLSPEERAERGRDPGSRNPASLESRPIDEWLNPRAPSRR